MSEGVVTIFEAIGELEVVLTKLRAIGLDGFAEQVDQIQNGLIDDMLDRGEDLALDEALTEEEESSVALPESIDKDSAALEYEPDEADAARPQWKRIFKRRPKPKRYLWATRPQKKRTRKGKIVWYSMLRYRRSDGREGMIFRVVGRDPTRRPAEVRIGGKPLRLVG